MYIFLCENSLFYIDFVNLHNFIMMCYKSIVRCYVVLVLMMFFVNDITAQFLGTSTNYSGSRGLAINPSLMTTTYVYADLGLNLGQLAYNDFAYLHASDYYKLLNGESTSDYYVNGKRYDIGFLINTKPKNLYETLDFNVASAMYNRDGKSAFGFFINNRVYTYGKRIPWEILEASIVSIENGDYYKNYKSKNTRVGMMAWSEMGVSYSRTVYDYDYDKIDLGFSVKGLLGYAGVHLNLKDVDKDIISNDTTVIHNLDMMAAVSGPVDYMAQFSEGEIFDANRMVNGFGAGFDIGFTYTRKRENKMYAAIKQPCAAPVIQYVWRLGVSLLDVGALSFRNNARVYRLGTDTDKIFDVNELEGSESIDDMMNRVSGFFYDNPSESLVDDRFLMGLPTAMSVQFDYSYTKNIFVNATWIQPVHVLKYYASRPALLMVEPRYESSLVDFAIPVTLYNYKKLFLGAELRLAFLTVGTHNIFNFLGIGESYGLDVYAALKINLYKGKCTGGGGACWNADFR